MIIDWNADGVRQTVERAAARGVFTGIRIVEAETLRLILNTAKTGRIYRRRGVEHQASAPGEAPASDTGRLVASRTIQDSPTQLKSILYYRTAYAAALEYGTATIQPRPFAVPALVNTSAQVREAIAGEVRAALR